MRGRIRFEEQLRRRYGRLLPVEVRYNEFTDDVLENRLVKAAVGRLASMRIGSPAARCGLGWIAGTLANVAIVEFAPAHVPEPRFDRLNEHYREVVALARLVLRHSAFQSSRGEVRAKGFLFDMNAVFQQSWPGPCVKHSVFLNGPLGSRQFSPSTLAAPYALGRTSFGDAAGK